MKKYLQILAVTIAFALAPLSALAQTYGTIAITACPASVILNTSSNFSGVIDCRQNRNITFDIYGRSFSATNTTFILTCVRSDDLATFETTSLSPYVFTLTIPTNAITYHLITNIDVGACGYLVCTNVAGGAGTVTNCGVTVALKPGN
jgi:hypothetical protein